jgi:lysophospholipase L1-like esterase
MKHPIALLCLVSSVAAAEPLPLPEQLYAVVGTPLPVFHECLVANSSLHDFDVSGPHGRHLETRWTHGYELETGTFPLEFAAWSKIGSRELVGRGATKLKIAPGDAHAGRSFTLLAIGDSLTHGIGAPPSLTWASTLLTKCSGATNPTLTLVGSFQPDSVNQPLVSTEAMGGWTAKKFVTFVNLATRYTGTYSTRGSPFLSAVGGPLDFAGYYTDRFAGIPPDICVIFLGPNDLFAVVDGNAEATADEFVFYLKQLVEAIEAAGPTKVGIMTPLPCGNQDGIGQVYTTGLTAWQYRDRQMCAARKLCATFGKRIVATHLTVDPKTSYPATDSIHPLAAGHSLIADTVFAWIKNLAL